MEDSRHIETPRGSVGIGNAKRARIDARNNGQFLGNMGTPSLNLTPASSLKSQKNTLLYNPFPKYLIPKLSGPVWSPRTMEFPVDTPPQTRWNIDQMSKLHPVNIEESPSSHHMTEPLEQEIEDKAQADSQSFFDSHNLPSPIANHSSEERSYCVINRKVDKCVGTDLSFHGDLPRQVMDLLESYSQQGNQESTDSGHGYGMDWRQKDDGHKSFIDAETESLLNNSSNLRRKLEFSFDHLEDSLLKSDESDIEERRYHGALVVSP